MNKKPPLLNPGLANLQASATLAINEQCQALLAAGRPVARLGFGQSPFPVPAAVTAELRAQASRKDYLPVQGLPALRAAVAGYLQRSEGLDWQAAQILVGPGTKELMFLLQLSCRAELLLPAPSWVSYAPQARILGRPVSWLQSDLTQSAGLDPAALAAHCRAGPARHRLLVLNYPNNPSGDSYSADQLRALAAVAKRYQLLVLSDEIYSGLDFAGQHVSLARFYPEGTIICNGLSKWCGAGGWRLGFFAFPRALAHLQKAMAALATETYSAVNSPTQYAAVVAFGDHPEMAPYLRATRQIMQAVLRFAAQQLRAVGARVGEARGGFYLFPHFVALQGRDDLPNSAAFCRQLLREAGVALLPGSDFGRPPEELSARLAGVDFDGAVALQALADGAAPDDAFLRRHCANTVAGIDRLCAWVKSR